MLMPSQQGSVVTSLKSTARVDAVGLQNSPEDLYVECSRHGQGVHLRVMLPLAGAQHPRPRGHGGAVTREQRGGGLQGGYQLSSTQDTLALFLTRWLL